jgi:hypothetical protein
MQCDDCQMNLDDFRRGLLSTDAAGEVSAHLAECPACARMLEEADRIGMLLRVAAADEQLPSDDYFRTVRETVVGRAKVRPMAFLRQRTVRRLLELAAVFVAGGLVVFLAYRPDRTRERTVAASPARVGHDASGLRARDGEDVIVAADRGKAARADRRPSRAAKPAEAEKTLLADKMTDLKPASKSEIAEVSKAKPLAKSLATGMEADSLYDLKDMPAAGVSPARELALARDVSVSPAPESNRAEVNEDKKEPAREEAFAAKGAMQSAASPAPNQTLEMARVQSAPGEKAAGPALEARAGKSVRFYVDDLQQAPAAVASASQAPGMSSGGPRITRTVGGAIQKAHAYDPTDGTVSAGDVWRVRQSGEPVGQVQAQALARSAAQSASVRATSPNLEPAAKQAEQSNYFVSTQQFDFSESAALEGQKLAQAVQQVAPPSSPGLPPPSAGESLGFFSDGDAAKLAVPITPAAASAMPAAPQLPVRQAAGADQRQVMLPQDQLYYNARRPASAASTRSEPVTSTTMGLPTVVSTGTGPQTWGSVMESLRRVVDNNPGTEAAAKALVQLGDVAYDNAKDYARAREAYQACLEPPVQQHLTTETLQRVRLRLDTMTTATLP